MYKLLSPIGDKTSTFKSIATLNIELSEKKQLLGGDKIWFLRYDQNRFLLPRSNTAISHKKFKISIK